MLVVPSKKLRHGFWIIWHATFWVIWKVRNDIFFNDGLFELDDVVESIKVLLGLGACITYSRLPE